MKYLVLISIIISSSLGFAAAASESPNISQTRKLIFEKMESCGQAVFSDENWFVASLADLANGQGKLRITSLKNLEQSYDLTTDDTIVDVKIKDTKLYALTETTVEAWELNTWKHLFSAPSHPDVSKNSKWSKKATGFIFRDNKLLITHGVMGFSLFNPTTQQVEKTISLPTISSAQDITLINPEMALVAVDNADEAEFRGLYVLNLSTLDIVKQIKIDNAYPLSIRTLGKNSLLIGYISTIWKFDLSAALKGQEALPNRRTWKFPGLFDVDLRGKIFYDAQNMYSCFGVFQNDAGSMIARKPTALAFPLLDLKLNE